MGIGAITKSAAAENAYYDRLGAAKSVANIKYEAKRVETSIEQNKVEGSKVSISKEAMQRYVESVTANIDDNESNSFKTRGTNVEL